MNSSTSGLTAEQKTESTEPTEQKAARAGRRTRLHAFQVELVERMRAARSGLDARSSQLGIMLGDRRCLLNLQQTGEIVTLGALTEVPLTQDWFLGLMNVRGNLISVVDFARFHGYAATKPDAASRVVCLSPSLMPNGGLLVSRVIGLRNVSEMAVQAETVEEGLPAWFGRRYLDGDAQQWTELKLSAMVQDPNFLHVGM
jgi:twitching motility protein PilI